MQLIRTTLRIKKDLKKEVEMFALKKDQTFQEVLNQALAQYLIKMAKNDAKILFLPSHNLGAPLDNLTRDDFYDEPNIS